MKNRLLALALLCALLVPLAPAALADGYSYLDEYPEYVVESFQPNGYCYLYSEPSDIYGINRGRHDNGEWVRVVDWYADDVFCLVECPKDNRIGYIRKTCLRPI